MGDPLQVQLNRKLAELTDVSWLRSMLVGMGRISQSLTFQSELLQFTQENPRGIEGIDRCSSPQDFIHVLTHPL